MSIFFFFSNVDIGIKIQIIEDERLFCTSVAGVSPKLVIKSATLHILACLLEPQCLLQIHQKLNASNGSLQFQFLRSTVKTFSVESVSQSTNSYNCYPFQHTYIYIYLYIYIYIFFRVIWKPIWISQPKMHGQKSMCSFTKI